LPGLKALLPPQPARHAFHQANEILTLSLTLVREAALRPSGSSKAVRLTRLEFTSCLHCVQHHGHAVPPRRSFRKLWGYEPDDDVEPMRAATLRLCAQAGTDSRKPQLHQNAVYGAGIAWNFLRITDPKAG